MPGGRLGRAFEPSRVEGIEPWWRGRSAKDDAGAEVQGLREMVRVPNDLGSCAEPRT
jgi:hypothetical protein